MPTFTDSMKSFTEHLTDSVRERDEALGRIHEATSGLVKEAREFMNGVARDHGAMAHELHATLATARKDRCERSAALRGHIRESLGQMRDDLRETLTETRRTRQEAVQQMHKSFATARNDLAADLRSASSAWSSFAASRRAR